MSAWDWPVLWFASLGGHVPAILFEFFLLVSLIALRALERTGSRAKLAPPAQLVDQVKKKPTVPSAEVPQNAGSRKLGVSRPLANFNVRSAPAMLRREYDVLMLTKRVIGDRSTGEHASDTP
jgi:hypothetical protein